MKVADPTGMQVEDVDGLINYYKKLLEYSVPDVISGVTSSCVEQELDNYEMEMIDSYVSVNESPTSTIVYNGHIPVGENYMNSASGVGGCTEATILSVLDMYKITNQSARIQLNHNRNKNGWNQNVKNIFDGLKIDGVTCDIENNKKKYISLIETMKDDGNVFAANITLYNDKLEKYGHNVVVTGVRGNMIQYWDNSKGNINSTYKTNIQELYRFNMSGYNPWQPERVNIIIQSKSIFSW